MRKKYTKRDFIIILLIALGFTLLYFAVGYLLCIGKTTKVRVISECAGVVLPIVLLMSWYMCIERYVSVMYDLQNHYRDKKYLLQVCSRILLLIISGVMVYKSVWEVVIFPLNSLRQYMEEYDTCQVIKIVIALAWISYLGFNISIRKVESGTKFGKIIVSVMFFGLILLLNEIMSNYINEVWTHAWMQKMGE